MYIQRSRFGNFGASCPEQEFVALQAAAFAPTCKLGGNPMPMPAHICNPGLMKAFNLAASKLDDCKLKTSPEYAASHSGRAEERAKGKALLYGLGAMAIVGLVVLIKIL